MCFLCCRDLQYAALGGIKLIVAVESGNARLAVDFQLREMIYWIDGEKWWQYNEAERRIVEFWLICNHGLFY